MEHTLKESQQAQKPITELEMQRNQEVLTTPKETCDCAETSCPKGCTKQHTHKTFFCETCNPPDATPKEEEIDREIYRLAMRACSAIHEEEMIEMAKEYKEFILNIRREAIAEEKRRIKKIIKWVYQNAKENHICRFNDGDCNCECYYTAINDILVHLTQE